MKTTDTNRARRRPVYEYEGYAKLRPGRIHQYCPRCGRKTSNAPRDYPEDTPAAVLRHVVCDNCDLFGFPTQDYFDAYGNSRNAIWPNPLIPKHTPTLELRP